MVYNEKQKEYILKYMRSAKGRAASKRFYEKNKERLKVKRALKKIDKYIKDTKEQVDRYLQEWKEQRIKNLIIV